MAIRAFGPKDRNQNLSQAKNSFKPSTGSMQLIVISLSQMKERLRAIFYIVTGISIVVAGVFFLQLIKGTFQTIDMEWGRQDWSGVLMTSLVWIFFPLVPVFSLIGSSVFKKRAYYITFIFINLSIIFLLAYLLYMVLVAFEEPPDCCWNT